uniref:FHF complex subunit HOOK-interacting protein 1B n=1 Tax=Varanus komodoensis TaxID=61221 RepID=A0A8D2LPN9_VARKO
MERMSWLSKLNPRAAAGHRASRAASLQSPVTADPETCLMVFKNHWAQVLRILEKRGPRAAQGAADDLSVVRNNTCQMMTLLAEERARAEGAAGPILEFVAAEDVLERLLGWHLQRDVPEERKVELLKLYEALVGQARQPLLRQPAVLRPLLRLLGQCAGPASPRLEGTLVPLLSQLCVSVAREPPLLERLFHSPGERSPASLVVFSLLVPFIHHEGLLGQQARDALLLLMAVSAGNRTVAQYITDSSYFCPVLATGLSALYSSLPRKLEVRGDDWHFLRREDWIGVPSLVLFMNSLEFCNAVIQVAHPLVQEQLVEYIHHGFLVPVMGPALHKSSIEEMIASTAYLDLFLRSASEVALLKTFLRFLLLHRHDHCTILDTLVARVASNSRLCMVSLGLFRTLLSLHCEDVLLQLVLRYLIPCSHVMLSQRRAVKEVDLYGKAASKFLSLLPRCCRRGPESAPPAGREEEHASWSKARCRFEPGPFRASSPGHGSPSVDASSVVTVPKPSTPSRISFFMRQSSLSTDAPSPAGTPTGSPCHRPGRWEEVADLDGNYLEYLRDARLHVDRCVWACRVWSAPYDGEEPSASSLAPPPDPAPPPLSQDCFGPAPDRPPGHAPASPRTKKRGLPEGPCWHPLPGGLENGSAPSPGCEPGPAWPPPDSSDCLLEQLLGPAPLENGGGALAVETLAAELSRLEDELANGAGEPSSERDPLSREEEEAYRSFSSHPDSTEPPRAADPPAPVIRSPLRTPGQPPSQPFTGPFVAVLLAKLENMPQNSLYVNVLLTGLLAQLACHPQPLLRSFLLNTNMVFQPSVKSLIQVLGSVKNKIESFAASQEDFPALLFKAKKYLIARAKLDWGAAVPALPSTSAVKSRKPSIGELIMRHTNSPTRARQAAQLALQPMREGQAMQALAGASLLRGSAERQSEALRVKNAVYCAVIFGEFLKELAAIAQAHAVTSPFLLEPPEEHSVPGHGPF